MLSQSIIQDVITAALATGGDFAEVFVEDRFTNNLALQAGKIESSLSGRDYGIGIRVFKGLQSVYAYTTDGSKEGLLKAAGNAAQAIQGEKIIQPSQLQKEIIPAAHPISLNPREVEKLRKVDVMKKAYEIAKKYHNSIQQVTVRYLDEEQNVLIANSEGKFVEDRRVRSRLAIQSIAAEGNQMQTGFYGPGAHKGFEFMEDLNLEHYANEASRVAVTMLGAEPCPSGKLPVIIDNEFGGIIFHEACGHGLEATSVAKENSVFANRIGEKVASDVVTYIDDGTLANEWGSITIDDEGEKARKNVLIENGILKGYLIDKFGGRRMGMESTGSGRRQSYRFAPTSRMTNTYIANGKSTPEEIISNTEYGIYTKYMGGGQVNTTTGDYNFAVMEAYLVKEGKIGKPLKGATLIGNGPKTLQLVDMVGNNLDHGAGMCGSQSGSIPVNVGQPMIRVSEMTVGGTKGANNMNLQEFKEKLFHLGGQHGFTDMELYYEREEKFSCELYKGEIDSYDTSEVFGTSFRGLYEGRMGYAFTEKMDEESLSFLIENVKENSQFIEDEVQEEIFAGSKKYEAGSYYSSSLAEVTIPEKINLLKEIEKQIYAYDERVTGTDYFMLSSGETERVLLNSKGLILSEKTNHAGIYVSVIVKQGDLVKNGEYSKFTRDFSILNPEEIAKYAVEEALSQLNARSAESKKYPVLLRNDAASALLQTYIPIFSAENTQKGQSALKGKTGEIIAAASLNIVDDPFLEEGLLSSNFDSEGVATARKDIVKDGRLVTLMHNRKTAQKDGVESTGNAYKASYKGALTVAPTNLHVIPSDQSYDELVSSLSEGIIITELSGLHSGANTVSGDFSIAANGYYVRDGKMQNAVNQMTIAGNFYELLNNIEAIGSDLEFSMGFMATGYIGSPSLLIRELAVTVE